MDGRVQSMYLGSVSFFVLVVDVEQVQLREMRVLEESEAWRLAIELGVGMVAALALEWVN